MRTGSLAAELSRPLFTVLWLSLAINVVVLAPSIFMLQVLDRVLATRSVETLIMLALITTAALLLMGVLDVARTQTLAAIGVLIEQRFGPALLARELGGGSRAHHAGRSPRILQDLAQVRAFLGGQGTVALCDAPWTPVYLLLIYLFHPVLGLLATVCTAVLLLLAWLNQTLTRPAVTELNDLARASGRFVEGALRQHEAVRALGMGAAVIDVWTDQGDRVHRLQLTLASRAGMLAAAGRVGRQMTQVLMLGTGAFLVIHEGATAGVMLATTVILTRAMAPVELLVSGWRSLVEARAALARLALGELGLPVRSETVFDLASASTHLEVHDLCYTPPGAGHPALQPLSFEVTAGEVLAVVGPSGSGKSTLARLLVGALKGDGGSVRFGGSNGASTYLPGAQFGYVPQDPALLEGTVAQNIARWHHPSDSAAVVHAALSAHVDAAIRRLPLGYDTPVGDGGLALSGGQRQLVALARALYGQPSLVVLDEADSALDIDGERAICGAIADLKARGAIVVVVSQRRAVLQLADRVMVLKGGVMERLVKVGAAGAPPAPAGAAPA